MAITDKWFDVPTEQWREYVSATGEVYRLEDVVKFWVSPRGTHYCLDKEGVVHTIMKEAFKVCRFFDTEGASVTAPRDKA